MQVNQPKFPKTFSQKHKRKKQTNKQKEKQGGAIIFLVYITGSISLKYDLNYI